MLLGFERQHAYCDLYKRLGNYAELNRLCQRLLIEEYAVPNKHGTSPLPNPQHTPPRPAV